jgi:hypothetical protein
MQRQTVSKSENNCNYNNNNSETVRFDSIDTLEASERPSTDLEKGDPRIDLIEEKEHPAHLNPTDPRHHVGSPRLRKGNRKTPNRFNDPAKSVSPKRSRSTENGEMRIGEERHHGESKNSPSHPTAKYRKSPKVCMLKSHLKMQLQAKTKKTTYTQKLGIIEGVYIPTFQSIVGIIIFVRMPWIVGYAGLSHSLLIASLSIILTFITALSMCAIVTNGRLPGGGAYYIISRSLGKEIGGSVGILFYLGNVIGSAMYALGIVEILTHQIAPGLSLGDTYLNARVYGTALIVFVALLVAVGKKLVNQASVLFFGAVVIALLASLVGLFATNRSGMIE